MNNCRAQRKPARSAVSVEQFYRDNQAPLRLRWISGLSGGGRLIEEASIHRPGLALASFFDYFADKRVQIFGGAENAYLRSLTEKRRRRAISKNFRRRSRVESATDGEFSSPAPFPFPSDLTAARAAWAALRAAEPV